MATDSREPLTLAQHLARSAGGSWVVLAPKPLDEINWQPNPRVSSLTVGATLEAIRKAKTPLAWETRHNHMLLFFGPAAEMARLDVRPPPEIVGLYLAAESGAAMLQALADQWQIRIQAEPGLFDARDRLAASRSVPQEEEPRGVLAMFGNPMGYGRGWDGSAPVQPAASRMLEFKLVERVEFEEVMPRLASYFGGECQDAGAGQWVFTRLSDPRKLAAAVDRLKKSIEQNAGPAATPAPAPGQGDETPVVIPAPSDELLAALDGLGVLGAPAVPALSGLLDPERPSLAQVSMRVLGEMRLAESRDALVQFGRVHPLRGYPGQPRQGKAGAPRRGDAPAAQALQAELVRILSRDGSPAAVAWLAAAARDERFHARTRATARMALLSTGNVSTFEPDTRARGSEPTGASFVLRDPHAAPGVAALLSPAGPTPDAITPLASTTVPGGDSWAVFVSGRYGSERDLWLARGRDHQWVEFLFTGKRFPVSRSYSAAGPPRPGSCVIQVKGDQVALAPPDTRLAAEEKRLQKAMADGTRKPQERQKLAEQYYRVAQQLSRRMQRPVVLSLVDLRKDTDHDGLPDIVEARLGLDPAKADTDGDGVPDGRDANPLARPNPQPSDRVRLLQAVFSALYGGDPSPDPILVVLEPDYGQEFQGARGRVLCLAKDEYLRRGRELGSMRLLQFGGPADAEATILRKDGPCLFDADRTHAELHFWQWPRRSTGYTWWNALQGSDYPVDYLARFERRGEWKLISIKPWRFDTADRAVAEYTQRMAVSAASEAD